MQRSDHRADDSPDSLPNYNFKQGVIQYKNRAIVGSHDVLSNKLISALHNSEF